MALKADSKTAWQRALADDAAFEETYTILNGGTAASLTANAKIVLGHALALDRVKANVIAAFESGTALTDESKIAVRNMVGDIHGVGDDIITHMGAIA